MWQYALHAGIGLQYEGVHPRDRQIRDLIDELRKRKYNAGRLPDELETARTTGFWPRSLTFRLSKWQNHDGHGEPVARKLGRVVFRDRDEPDNVPRRFLSQRDHPIGDVVRDYQTWADDVIRNWGGAPSTDPRILAALVTL
jgi:hypothetical protein